MSDKANRELASSSAQNEAFTTRTVAVEALFLGKGGNSQEPLGV